MWNPSTNYGRALMDVPNFSTSHLRNAMAIGPRGRMGEQMGDPGRNYAEGMRLASPAPEPRLIGPPQGAGDPRLIGPPQQQGGPLGAPAPAFGGPPQTSANPRMIGPPQQSPMTPMAPMQNRQPMVGNIGGNLGGWASWGSPNPFTPWGR